MKKAIAMLLMLAMTLCAAGAMASELEYNEGDITYVYEDMAKTVRVKRCDTAATSVAISAKSTVLGKEYRVTSIMNNAFDGCTNLKSVTFSGMEPPTFANNLFINCGALQKIYVPEGSEEDYKKALKGQYVSERPCASMVEGYALPQPAPQQPADLPQTGDHSSLALWIVLLAMAGVGMTMRRREA